MKRGGQAVIPFGTYQLHQAERAITERERRMADVRSGELAAVIGEVGASVTRRAKVVFRFVRRVPRLTPTTLAKS
jgi:hypothetical protein